MRLPQIFFADEHDQNRVNRQSFRSTWPAARNRHQMEKVFALRLIPFRGNANHIPRRSRFRTKIPRHHRTFPIALRAHHTPRTSDAVHRTGPDFTRQKPRNRGFVIRAPKVLPVT